MLIELAIGDAYGAGFEFVKDIYIEKHHKMEKYIPHFLDEIEAGHYTDDTQMTLAISELLLEHKEWNPELIANYFLKVFKRDPIDGYAKGFQRLLSEVKSGFELISSIESFSKKNGHSNRNGAAMRSVPLGLIKDKNELLEKAKMQAAITHNTEDGIYSSQAIALIARYFLDNSEISGFPNYISNELGRDIDTKKSSRCQCDAVDTVNAVATVLLNSKTLSEIIDNSVKMGGDTDSVASIACGIASLGSFHKNDLPEFMYSDLQDGKYGKDYLLKINKELMNKFSN